MRRSSSSRKWCTTADLPMPGETRDANGDGAPLARRLERVLQREELGVTTHEARALPSRPGAPQPEREGSE